MLTRAKRARPKPLRTWLTGICQMVETVNHRLLEAFGLDHGRPARPVGPAGAVGGQGRAAQRLPLA
jgi:hypothetical protein